MSTEIDLGEKEVANVKLAGKVYKMDLPTVKAAKKFDDLKKQKGEENLDLYVEFLSDLGLPKDICESLTLRQFKKLSEGLMGDSEKK